MPQPLSKLSEIVLSREQVRNCDRIAQEKYHACGLVLMENAGLGAAQRILALLPEAAAHVCIFAGPGNNGGDGFVVSRQLYNAGVSVEVLLCCNRERIGGDAQANLRIIEALGLPIIDLNTRSEQDIHEQVEQYATRADMVIDAMLGTGAAGPLREPFRSIIPVINRSAKTVVALDIPSGLDCNTGQAHDPTIQAHHTITFAAMKRGFLSAQARQYTGKITTVSIGIHTVRLLDDAD